MGWLYRQSLLWFTLCLKNDADLARYNCNVCPPIFVIFGRSAANRLSYQHTQTHTHLINGPLFGTTQVRQYQKGKTNLDFTEARGSVWQWYQLGHMQVCTSLQTDNHASTPALSFFDKPDALPAAQPTASKHWRLSNGDLFSRSLTSTSAWLVTYFQTKSRGIKSLKESTVAGGGSSPPVVPFVVSSSSLSFLSFPSNKTPSSKCRRRQHHADSFSDAVTHSRGSLEGLNQVTLRFPCFVTGVYNSWKSWKPLWI